MALPANPVRHQPRGLYDALDGSNAPDGACFSLQNLMRDTTTPRVWQPRPAVVEISDWTGSGFTNPTVVSVAVTIGPLIFGMVATDSPAGKDRPFCYDTDAQAFVSITNGGTSADLPDTLATSGAWVPPTMTQVGVYIIICHDGYSGTGDNFFGAIDITNLAAPVYSDENTATTVLPGKPIFAFAFFDRAYYAVNNQLWYSDVLAPLTITAGTQFLTLGDAKTALTGAGGIPLATTTGGIVAAYMVFKAEGGYWQLTGDAALTAQPLTLNGPVGNVGCSAPRTIQQTPAGLFFLATGDGIRVINNAGIVSLRALTGVQYPFVQALTPSRAVACFNGSIYRICLETLPNPIRPVQGVYDYWYDFEINEWCGPHTFAYDVAVPLGDLFAIFSNTNQAAIYTSSTFSQIDDVFTELGADMLFVLQSSVFPTGDMSVKAVIESTMDLALSGGVGDFTCYLIDESLGILGQATIVPPSGPTIWGAFTWGSAPWYGTQYGMRSFNVDWETPIVYKKAAMQLAGTSFQGLRIGNFWQRVEALGYMNIQNPP